MELDSSTLISSAIVEFWALFSCFCDAANRHKTIKYWIRQHLFLVKSWILCFSQVLKAQQLDKRIQTVAIGNTSLAQFSNAEFSSDIGNAANRQKTSKCWTRQDYNLDEKINIQQSWTFGNAANRQKCQSIGLVNTKFQAIVCLMNFLPLLPMQQVEGEIQSIEIVNSSS